MNWSFEKTPNLQRWFSLVSQRQSYKEALLEWQPAELLEMLNGYTMRRISAGTAVSSFQKEIEDKKN